MMIASRDTAPSHKVSASRAKTAHDAERMNAAPWKAGAKSLRMKRSLEKKNKRKRTRKRRKSTSI